MSRPVTPPSPGRSASGAAAAGGPRIRHRSGLLLPVLVTVLLAAACGRPDRDPSPADASDASAAGTTPDGRSAWGVAEGLALEIDTRGFVLPTALAFVPEPGDAPNDPLYFVLELRGTLKVVTRDRSVFTFAEQFTDLVPVRELPANEGQVGAAGLCLAPAQGYVFVTFVYRDSEGVLRNDIVRFQSEPGTFGLQEMSRRRFTALMRNFHSGISHQIGSCHVEGDRLLVSVGDAVEAPLSQRLSTPNGKLLRLTLDGEPAPENPFFRPDRPDRTQGLVFAYGLRNPFSLQVVDGRVFVADNGISVDRFHEVRAGVNYLWDGTDASMTANADYVFVPSVAPVQMAHFDGSSPALPARLAGSFLMATSSKRPEVGGVGVLALGYSTDSSTVRGAPEWLVQRRRGGEQQVTGLALGPDGLYFTPLLAGDVPGPVPVFRLTADPDGDYPHRLPRSAQTLIMEYGCIGCHRLDGRFGMGALAAPTLDTRGELVARLRDRLGSRHYEDSLRSLTARRVGGSEGAAARRAVLEAEGHERVRTWLVQRILAPRFDQPEATMPDLGLHEDEAAVIADTLMAGARGDGLAGRARLVAVKLMPRERYGRRHVLAALGFGFVGAVGVGLLGWALHRGARQRLRVQLGRREKRGWEKRGRTKRTT